MARPDVPRTRTEHDSLGTRAIPARAYWGIHTLRAVENFRVEGRPAAASPELITALATIKQAAAAVNLELGTLTERVARAIISACEELRAGLLHDQFPIHPIQGGAGTSTNMNANEVIANRALELLGHARGRYDVVHPVDHVNRSQSTNDVYPTAARIALHGVAAETRATLGSVRRAFERKAAEYHDVVKLGRTQLQDAVPMTLGQELGAFAVTLAKEERRIDDARAGLEEVNLGGTAIGTGLNAPPGYADRVCDELSRLTGIEVRPAEDLVEATQDVGAFLQLSAAMRGTALKLSKIANDLRLLSSGPGGGLGELMLPPAQAGSSIMPAKVNPVIPEFVNQVAFSVFGRDATVVHAAEASQLQLNAFLPVVVDSLLESAFYLSAACTALAECVAHITPNRARLHANLQASTASVTALTPYIGYEAATEIAAEAGASGRGVAEVLGERGLLDADRIAEILSHEHLVGWRYSPR